MGGSSITGSPGSGGSPLGPGAQSGDMTGTGMFGDLDGEPYTKIPGDGGAVGAGIGGTGLKGDGTGTKGDVAGGTGGGVDDAKWGQGGSFDESGGSAESSGQSLTKEVTYLILIFVIKLFMQIISLSY